ncbi:8-oxo-dGTP diphosphatase [Saccharopolyspora lacisalsi]|uniref:8-oxo-dGTP diphosphatase n=1 Tax=Halosaccharopolyspora lacisalsi TaxID=1000566 RepID=A0A839DV80_9PSEU|nr:NUDIX hydrolase [Halosaccharopolyspora lacisalsi]MBA8823195.1 8-oxo-dGTP diphosphatase [Halosaccharopolyspora lacisalsi]
MTENVVDEAESDPATARQEAPEPVREGTRIVRAAGAVVWRARTDGVPEIALVHRPHYDDWSLPKGKLDPGETVAHTAAREVTEETGLTCVLSRYLRRITYRVPVDDGWSAKFVDYFCAHVREGTFVANDEVDELRWMTTDKAREQLTHAHDGMVLDAFDELPTDVVTLLLVRHAKAGKSSEFSGEDALRPLSEAGVRQQRALRTLLPLFGPQRVHSAPLVRCERTVEPVAEDLGADIGPEPLLTEQEYWQDPPAAVDRLLRIASSPGTALVCSQGDVIPDLVRRLASAAGLVLEEIPAKKASVWTLTLRADSDSGTGLRLAAADYLPPPV